MVVTWNSNAIKVAVTLAIIVSAYIAQSRLGTPSPGAQINRDEPDGASEVLLDDNRVGGSLPGDFKHAWRHDFDPFESLVEGASNDTRKGKDLYHSFEMHPTEEEEELTGRGRARRMPIGACSGDGAGVDDDFDGVIMNYICSVVLLVLGSHLWWKHGWECAKVAVVTEYGMSLGYLTGGLVHQFWANRATDNNCASQYFYPVFCVSYEGMILSMSAWLRIAKQTRKVVIIQRVILVAAVLIAIGAIWCQFTVHLFPGKMNICAKGQHPWCDITMASGEAIFYAIWGVVWFTVAADIHCLCNSAVEKIANWLAPVFLALGPWQILLVSGVPMIFGGGPDASLKLYCTLRTGVTYIVAVLLCHVFTCVVSDRIFSNSLMVENYEVMETEAPLGVVD